MEQVRIDLVPGGVTPNAHASQYDIGRAIRFLLYNGGSSYTLAGTETITVKVSKPDGSTATVSLTNTSSNYVDIVTEDGLLPDAGIYPCEIKVTNGSDVIGSQNFNIRAEADAFGNGTIVILDAIGNPAEFNTDLAGFVVDLKLELPYTPNGYTSATVINSKTPPVFDLAPYLTRANTNTGNLALEKLVGLTVCFNQLVQNGNFEDTSNWGKEYGTISASGNKLTYTLTIASAAARITTNVNIQSGHKYFVTITATYNYAESIRLSLYKSGQSLNNFYVDNLTANNRTVISTFVSPSNDYESLYVYLNNGGTATIGSEAVIENVNIIDLTALFGSTEVADYLYTLESGTAGAGVAKFKALGFDAPYYPYTADQLMSSALVAKRITGFNQWDGEWEEGEIKSSDGTNYPSSSYWRSKNYIPILPNTTYYIYSPDGQYPRARFYDSEKNYLGTEDASGNDLIFNRTFTTASNAYFMRFAPQSSVAHAVCLNISDNAKNGTYEPYSETTIVYSGNELRGLLKVGTNGLYADGDIDDGSGTSAVRYIEIELGSLNWALRNDYATRQAWYTSDLDGIIKHSLSDSTPYNAIMSNGFKSLSFNDTWLPSTFSPSESSAAQLVICVEPSQFVDATAFKNYLTTNNVKLVIEKATPTTQTISAWTNPIVAKQGGTETFVDTRTIALPTGHDTIYGTDLVVKKAEFGQTVYGGSVDFTTGEVISNKNADGTTKTPADVIAIDPSYMPVFVGNNFVAGNTGGDSEVKYMKKA